MLDTDDKGIIEKENDLLTKYAMGVLTMDECYDLLDEYLMSRGL